MARTRHDASQKQVVHDLSVVLRKLEEDDEEEEDEEEEEEELSLQNMDAP